jgi:hypothetical protein
VPPPSVVTTVAAVRRDAGDEALDADATLDLPSLPARDRMTASGGRQ